jgi:hypothetical protein
MVAIAKTRASAPWAVARRVSITSSVMVTVGIAKSAPASIPWNVRARIRASIVGASAHAMEAARKIATAIK